MQMGGIILHWNSLDPFHQYSNECANQSLIEIKGRQLSREISKVAPALRAQLSTLSMLYWLTTQPGGW
jgi:hypothetical protein